MSGSGGRSGRQSESALMELSADVFGSGGAVDWQGEIDDLSWKPSEVTGLRRPGKGVILAALKTAATPPNHLHTVQLKDA